VWAAARCIAEFPECACAVIKHATPSGVALAPTPAQAFVRARDGDALSAFGGVVIVNRPGDAELATALGEMFLEVVAAPSWTDEALAILARRRALRVLSIPDSKIETVQDRFAYRSAGEGTLVQTRMRPASSHEAWTHVAGPAVESGLLGELDFAWRIVRHVRSNAIALTRDRFSIGLGGGQTSRIDALDVALMKAARCGHVIAGSVLASDAFFPFRDVVDRAAANGVRAVVQPGGSRNDAESIAACGEHGMAMFFTGERVFAH
jgi:phosphoribosylaminoimidazolecarboxamide formyltransferase/IMP cyclohydrolase